MVFCLPPTRILLAPYAHLRAYLLRASPYAHPIGDARRGIRAPLRAPFPSGTSRHEPRPPRPRPRPYPRLRRPPPRPGKGGKGIIPVEFDTEALTIVLDHVVPRVGHPSAGSRSTA